MEVRLPGLDRAEVEELKLDGTRDEELYRMLLLAQCSALHRAMPFLFDPVGGPAELLLPTNLLHTDSLIRQLVEGIGESDWERIEIIGWLYQYYVSERKDEVIGKTVATEDIPAATQLFTPHWIVQYLVQNSLGAMWLATYPQSGIKERMDYYIKPAEQEVEVEAELRSITPRSLDPETITLLDPACGSGHILVEAYDLFKAIYLERGYLPGEVPKLILEQNLYGLDIDRRAGQLTGFALMMKGRADDPHLLDRGVQLNVMALANSKGIDIDSLGQRARMCAQEIQELIELFKHAATCGSLIQAPESVAASLPELKQLCESAGQISLASDALMQLGALLRQAELLARRYDVVVANPPYMGVNAMNARLKDFTKDHYPEAKKDLFACFIERGCTLAKERGYSAMVTMQSWMLLKAFERMRERLLMDKTVATMAHLGARAFGSITGEVVQTTAFVLQNRTCAAYHPAILRLLDGHEAQKRAALANGEHRFESIAQSEFAHIPGSPIAYWLSERLRDVFKKGIPLGKLVDARSGLVTGNNDRFLRRWWEVDVETVGFGMPSREDAARSGKKWFPLNKGGGYRRWFGNFEYVVDWEDDGRALRAYGTEDGGRRRSSTPNAHFYFREALTWSDISSGPTSFRLTPRGIIHNNVGHSAFTFAGVQRSLLAGYCNSPIVGAIADATNPTLHFEIGNF